MNPYESPHDLAAAFRMGELQAHLHTEREDRRRIELTNSYLLELLAAQHRPRSQADPETELLQQRLDVVEQRTRELELKLKDLQLEHKQKRHDLELKTHAIRHNKILGGAVCASPVEMENTMRYEKADKDLKAETQTYGSRFMTGPVATPLEAKKVAEKSLRTGVPEPEWLRVVEDKAIPKPSGTRGKPQVKRYFESAAVEDPLIGVKYEAAAKETMDPPQSQECKADAPQPVHPSAEVNNLSTIHPCNEPERYGRFERELARGPRSHGRPPPNPRPYYYVPPLPHQHWPPTPPYFPPHFRPRPPAIDPKLRSYRDLDVPAVPSFSEHVVSSSVQNLPPTGFASFSEDLYDDQAPNTDERNHNTTRKGYPPNAPILAHCVPAGLQKSIHAQPHWPFFKTALHNRRHVDLTNIPPATVLPLLMKQIGDFFVLSVTPPRRVVRVVSPIETSVTVTVTLEFARGDIAAAFVASTMSTMPIELSGRAVKAVQREEESKPIERSVGEEVWKMGASRRLMIEEAGAALRVPENLKYQIESCPYATVKGMNSSDDDVGLLQGSPEFLEDGAIRVTFLDVRDAIIAYKTWVKSPIFRNVGLSYERGSNLPELGEEKEEGEEEMATQKDEASSGNLITRDASGHVKRSSEVCKDTERIATDGSGSPCASSLTTTIPDAELEKEEDEGYIAGSSDLETSKTVSPPLSPTQHSKEPTASFNASEGKETPRPSSPSCFPNRRVGLYLASDEHDLEVDMTDGEYDRDDPRRSSTTNHNDTFLNYDGSTDDRDEADAVAGVVYKKPPTSSASSPAIVLAPTTTSSSVLQQEEVSSSSLSCKDLLPRIQERVEAACLPYRGRELKRYDDLEEEDDYNVSVIGSNAPTESPERLKALMGRSRWAP